MIIDNIKNIRQYASMNFLLNDVAEYMNSHNLNMQEKGITHLKDDRIILHIDIVIEKNKNEVLLEAHRKYIDIQFPLEQIETIGYSPVSKCTHANGIYDETNDIIFYNESPQSYMTIEPGMFAIFLPQDAHAPCIGTQRGKKAIFKIKIE